MRLGKIRSPHYRIVVADARTKRDGRAIEMIGKYHPKEDPSYIEVDSDRVQYWLSVGAQPTEPVKAILRLTGDWQRHVGEPVPEGALKTRPRKTDQRAVFETAAREAAGLGGAATSAPRGRRTEATPSEAGAGTTGTGAAERPTEA
jgi:small subunit ribosomal protein S16